MARLVAHVLVEFVFLLHAAVVVVALFGWLWPWLWPLYVAILAGTLISDFTFGYCILSKWEFDMRRKLNPEVKYDYTYASYYTYKLTGQRLRNGFLRIVAYIFLFTSLALTLFTHYGVAALS